MRVPPPNPDVGDSEPQQGSAKSAKQRKADFEERHLNRGLKDPTRPERWAVIVHLTAQAKENLAEMRRLNRVLKTGPTTNSGIVEEWLLSDLNADARTVGALKASSEATRKGRSVRLQDADRLMRRLESGIGAGDVGVDELETALLKDHAAGLDRWAANVARTVAAQVGGRDSQEELRWLLRDAMDEYIHVLLSGVFSNVEDHLGPDDDEAVKWMRRRLGIPSKG